MFRHGRAVVTAKRLIIIDRPCCWIAQVYITNEYCHINPTWDWCSWRPMTSVPMKVKEEEVQRIQKLNNTMLKTTLGPNVFF